MANRFVPPIYRPLSSIGSTIPGAKLYFYFAGTTIPQDTFYDSGLITLNDNPVLADGSGEFPNIFLRPADYTVVLTDKNDVELWSEDVSGLIDAIGDDFKVTAHDPADMTIVVGPGVLFDLVTNSRVILAATTSALITAPLINPRIDVVHVNINTGVHGIATGSEAPVPVAPSIPTNSLPLAEIALTTLTISITDSIITDIRTLNMLGVGNAASKVLGVAEGNIPLMDNVGYPEADGSKITNIKIPSLSGYIDGLITSNNVTDPDNDIDFAAGMVRDDTDSVFIILPAAITKRLDAVWVVGTDAGGLDTGTIAADSWYHYWIIRRSDTGVVDVLFSLSATDPTMPADYDQKQRIGACLTNATPAILLYLQHGDNFYWDVPVNDYAGAGTTTRTLRQLSVPTGLKVLPLHVHGYGLTTLSKYTIVTDPDLSDVAPSATLYTFENTGTTGGQSSSGFIATMTDVLAQIGTRQSGTEPINGVTWGWIDPRGRNT